MSWINWGYTLDWTYYACLWLVMITGLALNLLTLPGLWLLVGAYGLYGFVTGWNVYVGWPSFVALATLGLLAEIIEMLAGSAGAKKAGGSKRAMIGAVLGAFVGAIFFTGLVPIPVLGTVVGVCLGAFCGALVVELLIGKDVNNSLRVGVGAAKGRFYGIVVKSCFGVTMLLVAAVCALPIGAGKPAQGSSGFVSPATAPASMLTG